MINFFLKNSRGPTKLKKGPDRFSRFDFYWTQTNGHPDTQAKYKYIRYTYIITIQDMWREEKEKNDIMHNLPRAAGVHLNFQAGSTFPVPVCTVPSFMDRARRCNKVDGVRLNASYWLNLLLLKVRVEFHRKGKDCGRAKKSIIYINNISS